MKDCVLRNGLLPKKTLDGSRVVRVREDKYLRNPRTHSPNGSLIIHRDDEDPIPGNCKALIHPPLGSKLEYRGEGDEGDYYAETTLAKVKLGAVDCQFCSILCQGIARFEEHWKEKYNELRWIESQFLQYRKIRDEIPITFPDVVVEDEAVIAVISFPKGHRKVRVRLLVPPISHAGVGRREKIYELEYYSDPNDPSPWAAFGPSPHVSSNVLSESTIALIETWIKECQGNHTACKAAADGSSPTRLVRIARQPDSDEPIVQLHQTDDGNPYSYVALSHYWDYSRPLLTTKDWLAPHQEAITWAYLSPVLQDAIRISLRLGFDYIWIDSLCIIQGDKDDFQKEAPRMGSYYNQAAVVLAAHGFRLNLIRDGTKEVKPEPLRGSDGGSPSIFVRRKIDYDNFFNPSTDTSTYWGRAWCFQERLFASRILHFGGSYEELFFECNVHLKCECTQVSDSRLREGNSSSWTHLKSQLSNSLQAFDDVDHATSSDNSTRTRNDLWETCIALCEDFTSKGLTFASDTLPAMSSLARKLHPRLGTYFAGLWEHNLILGLQWEALNTSKCHRSEEYLAPSFSWASRTGPAVWYYCTGRIPDLTTHNFVEVLDVQCTPSTADEFGLVSGGFIILRGYTTTMFLDEDMKQLRPDGRVALKREGEEQCFVTLDSVEDVLAATGGMQVKCLDVMRDREPDSHYVSGLILIPADRRAGIFRRIGFSTMKIEHFEGAELETLQIV